MEEYDNRSHFIRVKCPDCEGEQIVFDRASIVVKCNMCGSTLAESTGGRVKFIGQVTGVVDK